MRDKSFLILSDGSVFPGRGFGHPGITVSELEGKNADASAIDEKGQGEVVFNTAMSGYHEVLTDPSYTGQIVTMTYPHIGNYGDDDSWSEIGPEKERRSGLKASGLVVRHLYSGPVPQDRESLDSFLKRNKTPGISEIDTRRLTLSLRDEGNKNGIIIRAENDELREKEKELVKDYLSSYPSMEGRNLIGGVGTTREETFNPGGSPYFALIDCGMKANILRELLALDASVTLLPSTTRADEILEQNPNAVLISNGPGDPAVLETVIETTRKLIGKVPLCGICLGHQVISLALGAKTFKMKFGHHGVNHPVRDEFSRRVFVTSQNHGFSVEEKSLPEGVEVWFRNANDGTVEGIVNAQNAIYTAQFHPESSPGPWDSTWIFHSFLEAAQGKKES